MYITDKGLEVTQAAYFAILAAKMAYSIGIYAALRFAIKRGSSKRLFEIAYRLQQE